jgi:predicted Zn-dependent peptidase
MMTALRRTVAAASLAFSLTSAVPTVGAAPPPIVHRHVLDNGMTVLVRESRVARVVAVSLQVRAGFDERPETAGITNFTQRMMVRGTTTRSAVDLAMRAEDLGGGLDAAGDIDYAEIRGRALSRHWEPLLDLVSEVVQAPAFPVDEIERTRRLLLGQIQTRADTPLPFAMDLMMRELYGSHPYSLPTAGRRETIQAVTRDQLTERYRQLYRPERVVLAVSGDVSAERVRRHVERLFRKLPRGSTADAATVPAPDASGARRVIERPARQAQVIVGFLGPRLLDPDYATVKVMTAIIGGGTAGRLFREIRERRGLAYSVNAQNPSRREPSPILGYVGTEIANYEGAETQMRQEFTRLREEPPTADELTRAKAYVLGALAMDRRSNARQAWYLAFFELAGAGWDFPERYAAAIDAVTAADVTRAARRYLERATVVVVVPAK